MLLSSHRGEESRVLTKLDRVPNDKEFRSVDAAGNLWVVQGRVVFVAHIEPDKTDIPSDGVLTIPTSEYFALPNSDKEKVKFRAPNLATGIDGRTWIWGTQPLWNSDTTLRGFYVGDGGKIDRHAQVDGIPDLPYTVVAPKDKDTFWVGVVKSGLYELDTHSFEGHRVPEPAPGALNYVSSITTFDDVTYITASSEFDKNNMTQTCVLWKLHKENWERIFDGLTYEPHPLARGSNALCIGTASDGMWIIPDTGPRFRVDWQQGFPLRGAQKIFLLKNGHLLALGHGSEHGNYSAREMRLEDFHTEKPLARNVSLYTVLSAPQQDSSGAIWTVRGETANELSCWKGGKWEQFPLPDLFITKSNLDVSIDSRGRVWITSFAPDGFDSEPYVHGPTGIFNPKSETWQEFPTRAAALEAQWDQNNDLAFSQEYDPRPVFGPGNQIIYIIYSCRTIWYFNGKAWACFSNEIVSSNDTIDFSKVFFDNTGRPCIVVNEDNNDSQRQSQRVLRYTEDGIWNPSNLPVPVLPDVPTNDLTKRADWPSDMSDQTCKAVVLDHEDRLWTWYVNNGQLFRKGFGESAPQFLPTEAHPFSVSPVTSGFAAPDNAVFLQLGSENQWALLRPRQPAVSTKIEIALDGAESAYVKFASNNRDTVKFVWRLDGGPWHPPQSVNVAHLEKLLGGQHVVEAFSLDRYLTPDPTLAAATFSVNVNLADQIAGWIAALGDKDFEARKAGIQSLTMAPDQALPALRSARVNASNDQKWWIDVAIQECERAASKTKVFK